MWRRSAALALVLAAQQLAAVDAGGQQKPSLIDRTGWVRFQLVLGRIEVANINSSQTRSATAGGPGDESYEKLLISADTEIPSLRYERHTAEGVLSVEVIDDNRLEINRKPSGNAVALQFRQIPGRDLVLTVGADATLQTYLAPSLWHMLFDAPEAAQVLYPERAVPPCRPH